MTWPLEDYGVLVQRLTNLVQDLVYVNLLWQQPYMAGAKVNLRTYYVYKMTIALTNVWTH